MMSSKVETTIAKFLAVVQYSRIDGSLAMQLDQERKMHKLPQILQVCEQWRSYHKLYVEKSRWGGWGEEVEITEGGRWIVKDCSSTASLSVVEANRTSAGKSNRCHSEDLGMTMSKPYF